MPGRGDGDYVPFAPGPPEYAGTGIGYTKRVVTRSNRVLLPTNACYTDPEKRLAACGLPNRGQPESDRLFMNFLTFTQPGCLHFCVLLRQF